MKGTIMTSHLHAALGQLNAALLAAPPDPGTGTAPPGAAQITKLLQYAAWIVFAMCVGGVLISAAMMAIKHRRGGGEEAAGGLGWVLGACIVAGSASALVAAFA
jgi:hypothetical protein